MCNRNKIKRCYVDLEFLNPGPWLYNFTVDQLRKRNKPLKPESIIRIMTGYLNLEKPRIPISYIPEWQIGRIIPGKKKLRKYTNLKELCIQEYPNISSNELEKKIRKHSKRILKRLADSSFRESSSFNDIMINGPGLYNDVNDYVIKIEEFLNAKVDSETVMDIDENPINSVEENTQLDPVAEIEIVDVQENFQMESDAMHHTSLHIKDSSIGTIEIEPLESVNRELTLSNNYEENDEILHSVFIHCKNFEEFIQSTNVTELAMQRLTDLNMNQNSRTTKQEMVEIIVENTWEQVHKYQIILRQFTLDRMKKANSKSFDEQTVQTNMYANASLDKPIVPLIYLTGFRNLFPNLYTFIKYTNVIRLLKQDHGLNVEVVSKKLEKWFNDLLKNPKTLNNKYSRIKINAKYLFQLQFEEGATNHNTAMIEEEIFRYFDLPSFSSYLLPAFSEGIPSGSTDIPEEKYIPQRSVHILMSESPTETINLESGSNSPNDGYARTVEVENVEITSVDGLELPTTTSKQTLPDLVFLQTVDHTYIKGSSSSDTEQINSLQNTNLLSTAEISTVPLPHVTEVYSNLVENFEDLAINRFESQSVTSMEILSTVESLQTKDNLNTRESSTGNEEPVVNVQITNTPTDEISPIEITNITAINTNIVENANVSTEIQPALEIVVHQSPKQTDKSEINQIQNENSPLSKVSAAEPLLMDNESFDKSPSPLCIPDETTTLAETAKQDYQHVACIPDSHTSTQTPILPESPINYMAHIPNVHVQPFQDQEPQNEGVPTVSQPFNEPASVTLHFENWFKNHLEEFKRHPNFSSLSKSYIKQKLNDFIDANILSQEFIESNVPQTINQRKDDSEKVNHRNSDDIDLDATQINPDTLDLNIKSEAQSHSPYSDDVEIVPNETEVVNIEDSMTVSQLLASDDDEMPERTGCYDLMKELNLNGDVQSGSIDPVISQPLTLSYDDLVEHTDVSNRKRERRKRKAITVNPEDNASKIKPDYLFSKSHETDPINRREASQLLNSQISIFLDSQLASSKQTPLPKQSQTLLRSTSKENNSAKKRAVVKRKLFENATTTFESHAAPHNLNKRAKHDYNTITKSLHNFKLINVKFLKKFYIQNRNKYIFSQNIYGNEDRISATIYAKHDRFTVRNQHLYKMLNLNKKQEDALKTLLNMFETYEYKLNTNYNCDVIQLILHLYFRTLPSISQHKIILNVQSKDVENLHDNSEALMYKYDLNGFLNSNKLIDLYNSVIN